MSASGVPFSFFCSLVREISRIRPSPAKSRTKQSAHHLDYPALHVFRRWVDELRKRFSPLPQNTTGIFFRLFFPEEDICRKYDIQEARMTKLIEDCFGISAKVFEKWSLEEASGCLGHELKVVLEQNCPLEDGFISPLTSHEVDELLTELASKSGYSHSSIRAKFPKDKSRTRKDIFRSLFRSLSPEDASILTQIILKDLKPLLYPLTEFHYTTALTKFNVAAVKMLTKEHAMDVWDPSGMFLRFYRVNAHMDEAAAFADQPPNSKLRSTIAPLIGTPVAIPKSEKARGCEHALDFFHGSKRVWAETKYDGERAQIHVQVNSEGSSKITIFSKSKRDSTLDRHGVHSVIRSVLGLDGCRTTRSGVTVKENVILDAEMVAFRGDTIDEFWRIRQLIEDTAYGIRARPQPRSPDSSAQESMNSLANEGLSLGLVFFDILYLDSESLLSQSYAQRRTLLESLIHTKPGRAILADSYAIDMNVKQPFKDLYKIFAEHIASCQEGLVLKAEDSRYNDYKKPWVKIKRDYLPDAGDKLDLVILGASWEKVRGRSLRVPPTTFTTFYLGAVESQTSSKAHFHAYFTVSYGLSRDDLERLNFLIKSSDPVPYSDLDKAEMPFTLSFFNCLKPPPTVILREPLLVSLHGAGFTKAARSLYYELRFPRITKFHLPSEKPWQLAPHLERVHRIALEALGRDRTDKDIADWAKTTWGKTASPKANCAAKWQAKVEHWTKKLARLDGNGSLVEVPSTPTRRKRTENDPPHETRASVRLRANSQPLSTKTNTIAYSMPTPPSSASPTQPWKGSCLVWFAPVDRPCASIVTFKKGISRERRLHSLDSLVMIALGVVIVDECNESVDKWKSHIAAKVQGKPDRIVVLVYADNGDPASVLSVLTYPNIPPPHPNSVNLKFLLAPINPADINVIEGVYPTKPMKTDGLAPSGNGGEGYPVFVGGNEGLARVTAVGEGVHSLQVNDWVVMIKQQAGTWATDRNVPVVDVAKVPDADQLTEVQAATMTVNPPTAYNMLNDFVELKPGDWVIQNGANSAVGQAVIQIAAARGLKSINLVRDRPNLDLLKEKLNSLGATHVLTYDELSDKSSREKIKQWTSGKAIRLGLNCVGGKDTTAMARFLGAESHLVSYGAMAKQPLSLPISLFIFKNLKCHGFWQSRWYIQKPLEEREKLMQGLVNLMKEKKLDTAEHEIVTIAAQDSDEEATLKLRDVMKAMSEGRYGKKILLRIES